MDAKTANTYLIDEAIKALEECKSMPGIEWIELARSISIVMYEAIQLKGYMSK